MKLLRSLPVVFFAVLMFTGKLYCQEKSSAVEQPLTVNGDTVEYLSGTEEIQATGNVRVDYRDARLQCEKLTVNTKTKEAVAEGSVMVTGKDSVLKGEKAVYNFGTGKGKVLDADFWSDPFYGSAEKLTMAGENQFHGYDGNATTCNYDRPHYHLKTRKVSMYPEERILTSNDVLYVGRVPVAYLPWYNQSLTDPYMHVQFTPGHSSEWGTFLLSAWRFSLSEYMNGRIYFDYRTDLGFAEGFGANYWLPGFGKGDAKVYYTQERTRDNEENVPGEFERYMARIRHKWVIDDRTDFVGEYYRIGDAKRSTLGTEHAFLKDYFPREYERDSEPLTYGLLHHSFTESSLDTVVQKRTNRSYSQLEKLPEVTYTLPSNRIGDSRLYFENVSQGANYNYKTASPSPSYNDVSVNRFDTYNELSLPFKAAFVTLTPIAANRLTYYSADAYSTSVHPRSVFYTGADASTRFFRFFDIDARPAGIEINGLRHVINPTVSYRYNPEPTVSSPRLKQIDPVDAIARSNAAAMVLSNKLQTKRDGNVTDIADLRVSSEYIFYRTDPLTRDQTGEEFSDVTLAMDLLPYSWLSLYSDAAYSHHDDRFNSASYDVSLKVASERSVAMGQRYNRDSSNQLIFSLDWRLNPKWKMHIYELLEMNDVPGVTKGLARQEYGFQRDLHCWLFDLVYSHEKETGHTFWAIFRLKAFPEAELNFSKTYNAPQTLQNQ